MAGLGGESGGERRIIIVDTYPSACGMRMRWVRRNIKQRDILSPLERFGRMDTEVNGMERKQSCLALKSLPAYLLNKEKPSTKNRTFRWFRHDRCRRLQPRFALDFFSLSAVVD